MGCDLRTAERVLTKTSVSVVRHSAGNSVHFTNIQKRESTHIAFGNRKHI